MILPFIQDEVEKLLGKKVVTFTNMFIQNLICLLFIYLFGLTYKTVILLVFYGKFEVFHDILFLVHLLIFSRFRSDCYYNFNDDKTKKLSS